MTVPLMVDDGAGDDRGLQVYIGVWILIVSLTLHATFKPFRDGLHVCADVSLLLLSSSLSRACIFVLVCVCGGCCCCCWR